MSIINSIGSVGSSAYRKIVNTNLMKKFARYYEKDNIRFISGVAVTSIVLKDALGCYMYVTQSLNNKKIPEDKRAFVAALDLTNGGLMIASQLLAFFTISNPKIQQKMFNSWFGKALNRSFRKGIIAKLERTGKYGNLGKKMLNDSFKDFTKKGSDALNMATSLVASTILAKRVVVPYIATPLASYLKENHMNGKKGAKDLPQIAENKKTELKPEEVCKKHMQTNLSKYNIDNFTKVKQPT